MERLAARGLPGEVIDATRGGEGRRGASECRTQGRAKEEALREMLRAGHTTPERIMEFLDSQGFANKYRRPRWDAPSHTVVAHMERVSRATSKAPPEMRPSSGLGLRPNVIGPRLGSQSPPEVQVQSHGNFPTLITHHIVGSIGEELQGLVCKPMLVRAAGLEPARPCGPGILSAMRLPFRHARRCCQHSRVRRAVKREASGRQGERRRA